VPARVADGDLGPGQGYEFLAALPAVPGGAVGHRLAGRIRLEADDDEGRIALAYGLAFGRPPEPTERDEAIEFLRSRGGLAEEPTAIAGAILWATRTPTSIRPRCT